MVDPAIKERILEDLEALTPERQKEAERFVHSLREADALPPPTHGKDLLDLAGILDDQSAREIMEAIEKGCKQVDPSDW